VNNAEITDITGTSQKVSAAKEGGLLCTQDCKHLI